MGYRSTWRRFDGRRDDVNPAERARLLSRRRLLGTGATAGTGALLLGAPRADAANAFAALAPTSVKTGNYTASPGDFVPVSATGATVTIALPSAPSDQAQIGVKVISIADPQVVTVSCGGSDVFDRTAGPTSLDISSLGQGVLLQYQAGSRVWYVQAVGLELDVPRGAAKLGSDGKVGTPGGSQLTNAVTNVANSVAYPESYGAKGDGITDDSIALRAWVGSSKLLALTPGKTYVHQRTLTMSFPHQVLDGNGACLKRAPQAITTTTTSITSGVSTAISVAATSGGAGPGAWSFQVGDQIVVEQGGTFDQSPRTIKSIAGNLITVSSPFGVSLSGTINVRHGWNQIFPNGTGQRITDLVADGNSDNWSWARWQHTAGIQTFDSGTDVHVDHCQIINQYGDALAVEGARSTWAFNEVRNIKGRGFVFTGIKGAPTCMHTRVLYNDFINCNLDPAVSGTDGQGSIDFSQGGPGALIHGNTIDGGIDGVGGLRNANNDEVSITGNEFWNCTGWAINGGGSNTQDVANVIIANNRLYGAGINLNRIGSTGLATRWHIHDNIIIGAGIAAVSVNAIDIHDNTINCDALTPPIASEITVAALSGGGTFSAGTYYWVITAYNGSGETTGSAEVSAGIASGGSALVSWNAVPGAQGYKLYRASSSGGENSSPALVATIASATTLSFSDTGTPTVAGAVPSKNTTKSITAILVSLGGKGGAASGRVHDNVLTGGNVAVLMNAGCSNLSVSANTCRNQYSLGIGDNDAGTANVTIKGNTVVNDSTAIAGDAYHGITPQATDEVANNTVDISAGGGFGIAANTGSPIITGNNIKTGGARPPIQINSGVTNAIVANNTMDRGITDNSPTTRRYGNVISTGAISGQATLVAGTKAVKTAEVGSGGGTNVLLTVVTPGGTPGTLSYAINSATGITIKSTSNTDTSTVYWEIRH